MKKVEIEIPDNYEDVGQLVVQLSEIDRLKYNGDVVLGRLLKLKPQKTPKQLAAELGFKIGDKIWYVPEKKYYGEIKKFIIYNRLECITDNMEGAASVILNDNNIVTNKVAIYCPTKEDKIFIRTLLKHDLDKVRFVDTDAIMVNEDDEYNSEFYVKRDGYLLLSVDEYMQSQGIKPLFVTEDKVNIYEKKDYYYILTNKPNGDLLHLDKQLFTIYKETCKSQVDLLNTNIKRFSTEQASKEWLDEQVLFYTEDFKDGSFQVKSCKNCTNPNSYNSDNFCNVLGCFKEEHWKGELKGEPIRKGDSCWLVYLDNGLPIIRNGEFLGNCTKEKSKYFSNRKNAVDYYNGLVEDLKID